MVSYAHTYVKKRDRHKLVSQIQLGVIKVQGLDLVLGASPTSVSPGGCRSPQS